MHTSPFVSGIIAFALLCVIIVSFSKFIHFVFTKKEENFHK